ncbi:MAG: alpha-ketoglutarate-dependent dioxygenase AlkB [Chitinophagales bacterium]|nr:alpha-ketoglutarate-dependent dioxygenase AlkB [Chitinophagales bacterium]
MGKSLSDKLFLQLKESIEWRSEEIKIFGRWVMQPRLTAWYGNAGKTYRYSGIEMKPLPWTPYLLEIKNKVEKQCDVSFNSVLLNYYRTGADSMGWHSDDEPELGKNPVIASVSFGAERLFCLRHKKEKSLQVKLKLTAGSLLIMTGETQHHWQHAIPKTTKPIGERINLTFRKII